MNCCIHIGFHKTGSTSIQNFLQLNKNILSDQGIFTPDFDCSNHSTPIFSIYTKNPHLYMQNIIQNRCGSIAIDQYNNNNKKILYSAITENPGQLFIISGEGISRLDAEELLSLKNDMKKYFQHIFIFAYAREPFSYITSLTNQLHKLYGGLMCNYIKKIKEDVYFFINYKNILKKFINIFGKSNVICVNFDTKTFRNKNVIFDFIDRLKIEENINYTYPDKKNISLKKEASILFDIVNEKKPLFLNKEFPVQTLPFSSCGIAHYRRHLFRTNIRNILNSYGSNEFWIDGIQPSQIYDKIQSDIDWLQCNYGISFQQPRDTQTREACISPHSFHLIRELRAKLSKVLDDNQTQCDDFFKYLKKSLQEITIDFV